MAESFYDPAVIERVRRRIAGNTADAGAYAAERLAAAVYAQRRRNYFLVARLAAMPDAGGGAGVLPANAPVNLILPRNGVPRDTMFSGAITDAHLETALFNITRRRNLPVDVYEQNMLSTPQRAAYFCGDMNTGDNRILPAEYFDFPEPEIVEKGEPLNLIGQGDGAAADVSNCYVVFRGEQTYAADSKEGTLTSDESTEIERQIRNREQVTSFLSLAVDYANPATYTEVSFPILERYALLLGFLSVDLAWSTVDIEDERGQKWSNEPIPITALANLQFDPENTQTFYRKLLSPALLRPGDTRRPKFTFAERADTGPGDYPPDMSESASGELVAIIKTL